MTTVLHVGGAARGAPAGRGRSFITPGSRPGARFKAPHSQQLHNSFTTASQQLLNGGTDLARAGAVSKPGGRHPLLVEEEDAVKVPPDLSRKLGQP
jgi:hypothetical protein